MKLENKRYRIVIDSNIWISFLIGKSLIGLQNHINSQHIIILSCIEQFNELKDVFSRPKIKKHILKDSIIEFLELLEESSEIQQLKTKVTICRDVKDNYLLSLCIDSQADYLITGDKDLLTIGKINETKIISFTDFETLMSRK